MILDHIAGRDETDWMQTDIWDKKLMLKCVPLIVDNNFPSDLNQAKTYF